MSQTAERESPQDQSHWQNVDRWYAEALTRSVRPQKWIHWQATPLTSLGAQDYINAFRVYDAEHEVVHLFSPEAVRVSNLLEAYDYLYSKKPSGASVNRIEDAIQINELPSPADNFDGADTFIRVSTILIRGGYSTIAFSVFCLVYWFVSDRVIISAFLAVLIIVATPFFIWMGYKIRADDGEGLGMV